MITAIEIQKNNKNKVNVYVDGEYKCALTAESVVSARLKVGEEFSDSRLKELLETSEAQLAFDKALDYISRCMKTKRQVRDYLLGKGFDKVAVDKSIEKLAHYDFVNDAKYVAMYVEQAKKTKGAMRIKQELYLKGISNDLIEDTLLSIERDEAEAAAFALAEKFLKNKPIDMDTLAKLNRRLLSRGFDFETVNAVIAKVRQGWQNND